MPKGRFISYMSSPTVLLQCLLIQILSLLNFPFLPLDKSIRFFYCAQQHSGTETSGNKPQGNLNRYMVTWCKWIQVCHNTRESSETCTTKMTSEEKKIQMFVGKTEREWEMGYVQVPTHQRNQISSLSLGSLKQYLWQAAKGEFLQQSAFSYCKPRPLSHIILTIIAAEPHLTILKQVLYICLFNKRIPNKDAPQLIEIS